MHIISLGHACQVKYNIDRLFKKQITNFFDWLITDWKSVLYILKNINNKDFIIKSKFSNKDINITKTQYNTRKCHKVEHKDFKMISLHDFPLKIDYMKTMDEFIEKYNRRLDRLKDIIKSNENIHFIHILDHKFTDVYFITKEDLKEYKKYLNDINPNNNCFLHIGIPPKFKNMDFKHLKQHKIFIHYLAETHEENLEKPWTNTNFNWEIIFNKINNIEKKLVL